MQWYRLSDSTYASFDIGLNFVVRVDDENPDFVSDGDPLVITDDTGYTKP